MSNPFDLGGLGQMLGGFQQRMQQVQADAALARVTGQAAGGLVEVTATGAQEIVSVRISEEAYEDRELLEDLVRAACNDALDKSKAATAAKMAELTAGLPIPPGMLPGF